MAGTGLIRTQYWNVSGNNPTPRTGLTSRAESRTDVEGYLLAADAARDAALWGPGVASGLRVSAVAGATAVQVGTGVAVDAEGHVVVLAEGGVAITDPLVGPTGVQNIPTVPVTADGVSLDTTTATPGTVLLTVRFREVEEVAAGLLVLQQAPWLRLAAPGDVVDDGVELVLAEVAVDVGGLVADLTTGARRAVTAVAGGLAWRRPGEDPAAPAGEFAVAEAGAGGLGVRPDGGLDVTVAASSPSAPAMLAVSVLGGTGDVEVGSGLRVGGRARVESDLAVQGDVAVAGALSVTGPLTAASVTASQLAVRTNATVGAGGDGVLLTRHVKGKHFTSDAFDGLFLNWDTGFPVNVGGAQPADLNVTRNLIVGGRVGVRTNAPAFDVHVNGTVCAVTFCNPSDLRLKRDVREVAGVLDGLAGVRAVTFTRAEDDRDDDAPQPVRHAGVVAQDVASAFPELVVPLGPDGLMAVDYAGLAGVLVGAVNELRAVVESLADRVAGLQADAAGDAGVRRG